MTTILTGRQLLQLVDDQEKARRRARFEHRTGEVHKRRNTKNRKAEAQRANTKRGQHWKKQAGDA